MIKSKNTYQSKNSLRLKGYDYSAEGVYFITILTKNRICHFGEVVNKKMNLSDAGKIVEMEWRKTEEIRKEVVLGNWIVMPEHFHALIAFKSKEEQDRNLTSVKAHGHALLQGKKSIAYKNTFGPQSRNLSALVRSFKATCTSKIRSQVNPNFAWHRSFHDRIVRNQKELINIENYIISNPARYVQQFSNT
ncbi:MAG: transposase [Balneola sp.]